MLTVSSISRIASTAAWSASSFSPRPTQPDAASAAASVTRTSSRARLRSGAGALNPPRTLLGRGRRRLEEGRRVEQVALAGRQEDDLRRRLLEDLQRLELEVAVGQRARAEPLRLRLAARALDLLLRLGLRLLDLLARGERVLGRDLLALDRLA